MSFLMKLWHMLDDDAIKDIISWGEEGTSFIVRDQISFKSEVLPKYYKHNNISSFTRQLNKYGFKKVNNEPIHSLLLEFEHPNFVRGDYASVLKLKPRLHEKVHHENPSLEEQIKQLQAKQEEMSIQLSANKNERDALWREYSLLRQKQEQQSQVMNRLLHFIIMFMRSNANARRTVQFMVQDATSPNLDPKVTEINETEDNTSFDMSSDFVETLLRNSPDRRGVKRPLEDDEVQQQPPQQPSPRTPSTLVTSGEEEPQPDLDSLKDFLLFDNIPYPSKLRDLFGSDDPLGLSLPESFWKEAQETENEVVLYDGLIKDIFN